MALTPGMRLSLGMLRLPALALWDEILREAAENPFLVLDDSLPLARTLPADLAVAAEEGLHASLMRQIGLLRLDPPTEAAALFLAEELREDGYLDTRLEDLADQIGAPVALLEAGLAALQRCEPAGIGARNLAECLELQLAERGLDRALCRQVTLRLDDVARGRWPALSRALGITVDEVRRIADIVRTLSPRPVVERTAPPQTRFADIVVQEADRGVLTVVLARRAAPRVTLMEVGRATFESPGMRALFDRARHYLSGIAERSRTLLAVGRLVVDRQAAFFAGPDGRLAPLTRVEAARALGVHPSTLGRAVWGKGLEFAGKVHPLEMFFQRPAPGDDPALSAFDVQRRIAAIVSSEHPSAPLADEAIREHLRRGGVDIARRTVAKYRKCLRIAPSFQRRRR